jgi:hypothetical protein
VPRDHGRLLEAAAKEVARPNLAQP